MAIEQVSGSSPVEHLRVLRISPGGSFAKISLMDLSGSVFSFDREAVGGDLYVITNGGLGPRLSG